MTLQTVSHHPTLPRSRPGCVAAERVGSSEPLAQGRVAGRSALLLLLALVAGALLVATPARAADNVDLDVRRLSASPFAGDMFSVGGAGADDLAFSAGLTLSYAHNPLRIVDRSAGLTRTWEVVSHHADLEVSAMVRLLDRLSLAFALPVVLANSGRSGPLGALPGDGIGLGDMVLSARWLLIPRHGDGFGLAAQVGVGLPTASEASYAGSGGVSVRPRLIGDWQRGDLRIAVDLGGGIVGDQRIGPINTSSLIDARGGIRYAILGGEAALIGEGGLTTFATSPLDSNGQALEGQAGAAFCLNRYLELFALAGGGALRGVGSSDFRVNFGVRAQRCAILVDQDGDGVPDAVDRCPQQPGPRDSAEGRPGCPPTPPADRDGDGIVDPLDACPDVAGPPNADAARNGCPPPVKPVIVDRDGDGIADPDDACPDQAGVASPNAADHGCPPPPDTDGDGILDRDDACPTLAGVPSEHPGKHGCPPVQVTRNAIVIGQVIEFEVNEATIVAKYLPVLDDVADSMKSHPEITQLRVEGHTDARHTAEFNLALSKRRAAAVLDYLVAHGVDRARLVSQGYGESRPVASNDDEAGRQRNRRVAFVIVRRSDATNADQPNSEVQP